MQMKCLLELYGLKVNWQSRNNDFFAAINFFLAVHLLWFPFFWRSLCGFACTTDEWYCLKYIGYNNACVIHLFYAETLICYIFIFDLYIHCKFFELIIMFDVLTSSEIILIANNTLDLEQLF
jgi:hypothetical protein